MTTWIIIGDTNSTRAVGYLPGDMEIVLSVEPGSREEVLSGAPTVNYPMRGIKLLLDERVGHILRERWTPEHDAEHVDNELVRAAMAYLKVVHHPVLYGPGDPALIPDNWPWAPEWFKPSDDQLVNLVKAGSLIVAEIDRIIAATLVEEAAHDLGG